MEDYEAIKQLIEKEYDKLSETDQYILGEYLEFLELTIDMLNCQIFCKIYNLIADFNVLDKFLKNRYLTDKKNAQISSVP